MTCVCGAHRPQHWTDKGGVAIARCRNCGTSYPVARPSLDWRLQFDCNPGWIAWIERFRHDRVVVIDAMTKLAEERRSVDVFAAFDTLQDVADPAETLAMANAMLARDGVLLIEVPQRSTEKLHRWYFQRWGLEWLLEQNGFLILETQEIDYRIRITATPAVAVADLRVAVPSGIGDIHWLLTKLEALKEREAPARLTVVVRSRGDRVHVERSREFLSMVPFVDAVEFEEGDLVADRGCPDVLEPHYEWIANYHLESGQRLELWRPELPVNWNYRMAIPDAARNQAAMLREAARGGLVIFYLASSTWNHVVSLNAWNQKHWALLGEHVRDRYGWKPIVIGRDWDSAYADRLWMQVEADEWINLIERTPAALAAALLEQADLVVGMGTGITMLGVHLGARTIMFWPEEGVSAGRLQFDRRFQTNWVAPQTIASGRYVPMSVGRFTVDNVAAEMDRQLEARGIAPRRSGNRATTVLTQ